MIELAVVVNTFSYFRFNHRRDDPFTHQGKTKIASNGLITIFRQKNQSSLHLENFDFFFIQLFSLLGDK